MTGATGGGTGWTRFCPGGWPSGAGSLPGNGGCGVTPRPGIGSTAIGGITRVGGDPGEGWPGDCAGDCGGRAICDFGEPGRPSLSENLGVGERGAGATFSGGGAVGFSSCGFGGTGKATRWIGSRKRGPGTMVVPEPCVRSRGTPRGGWLMIVWLMIVV